MKILSQLIKQVIRWPRHVAVAGIVVYQHTLSPDHGLLRARYPYGFCRFYPSCSEHAKIVIRDRGVVIGSILSFWRVLRCNPWAEPTVESVHPLEIN